MAMNKARKRTLAVGAAAVGLAAAIAMTVLPSSAVVVPSVVRLHLATDGRYFEYGGPTNRQHLVPIKNSCKINESDEHLIDLGPTSSGNGPVPGVGPDGIGIKATPSSGNGSPCTQISDNEFLTVGRGADLNGRRFTRLELDLELTGNAKVVLVLNRSDGDPLTYRLHTGPDIPDDPGDPVDPDAPFEVESIGSDISDNCAAATSSGPNSAGTDNCRWKVNPQVPFDSFTLATTRGTVSLEGSGDFGGAAAHDTLLYLNGLSPTAANDSYTVAEDGTLTVPVATGVLANDVDDNPLSAALVSGSGPSNGTLNSFGSDGSFSYTPNADFVGTDTFRYTASDGGPASSEATVTITVTPVNDLPVANNDVDDVDEDASKAIEVLANDTDDDGDTLTPTVFDATVLPQDFADPDVVGAPALDATAVENPDGTITYTPPPGFTGNGSFSYKVNDGTADSNTASVTIEVVPVMCTTETVGDADGSGTQQQTSGSFTRLQDEEVCKRYTVDADKGSAGETGDEVVSFVPSGGEDVVYRGILQFPADAPPAPEDPEYPLLLQYDIDVTDEIPAKPVQWCINPSFTGGLVTSATLPAGENWCVAKAETVPNAFGLVTVWQVYGLDDPYFTR